MHFCISFLPCFVGSAVHIIEALNCFRLRLGFDLFSHSFHNLIKRLWFCCATEVGDGLRGNKRKSPFMDEGGWKDEHLHCVPFRGQMFLHLCIAYISRGGFLHAAVLETSTFDRPLNGDLLLHKSSISSHKTCDWCKFFHLNHVIRVWTAFLWKHLSCKYEKVEFLNLSSHQLDEAKPDRTALKQVCFLCSRFVQLAGLTKEEIYDRKSLKTLVLLLSNSQCLFNSVANGIINLDKINKANKFHYTTRVQFFSWFLTARWTINRQTNDRWVSQSVV